jgi:hypothetical protein
MQPWTPDWDSEAWQVILSIMRQGSPPPSFVTPEQEREARALLEREG